MQLQEIYENASMYEASELMEEISEGSLIFLMNDPRICMTNACYITINSVDEEYF